MKYFSWLGRIFVYMGAEKDMIQLRSTDHSNECINNLFV